MPDLHEQINPFLDYLSAECGLAANTIRAYRRDLTNYADFLPAPTRKHPDRITADDVLSFLKFRKEQGASSSSLARYLAAVKMLHRYLMLVGAVPVPVADILDTSTDWTTALNVGPQTTQELNAGTNFYCVVSALSIR